MRRVLPGPVPPVAAAPWVPPPVAAANEMGPQYGIQRIASWSEGETDPKQIIDVIRAPALWRISVFGGDVLIDVHYGTQANRHLMDLRAPLVMTVPGQLSVEVRPRNTPEEGETVSCTATLTQATAGERAIARRLHVAGGVANPFEDDAVSYFALSNSNVTVGGVLVAVPALSSVPLVAGSSLVLGDGFQEFEA